MTWVGRLRGMFINTRQADAQQVVCTVSDSTRTPRVGDVLAENYRLVREIERGALGVVYLAEDLALEQQVAVKVLLPENVEPGRIAMFRREARLLASVRHENVVRAYFGGTHCGTPFFVMEYLDGQTLAEVLKRVDGLGLPSLLGVALQICRAVQATHDAGVFHRDVKPANVVVVPGPRIVLVDFGLARSMSVKPSAQIIGTPDYLAPETARGQAHTPMEMKRCDVYAVGMTIYELMAGKLPFPSSEVFEVLRKHRDEDPQPPSIFRSTLPAALDRVILQAIARDPRERFQTCDELAEGLLSVQRVMDDE